MESVIAVDLGGTKLTAAVVDAAGGVSYRKKTAVNRGAPDAGIQQIARAIEEAMGSAPQAPVRAAGIIVPGIYFAGSGNVWAPNLWRHQQVSLRAELEQLLAV